MGIYVPGVTVSSLFSGLPNDTIVSASSQSAPYNSDFVTVTGVEHVSLCQVASWIPGCTNFDFPGETSSSAVFSEALSSLMGNALSGTVAQTRVLNPRERLGAATAVTRSLRSGSLPEALSPTAPAPVFDLTGYTQVPISNATFLPATGSTLTINSLATITVTSSTKAISEALLFQQVVDPTDFVFLYSTQAPFSMSFAPTRLGSMSFVVFAVFTDNTFATTTLTYNLAASGSPLDVRLPNPPIAALGVGESVTVDAIADFSNGSVDVKSAATYSAGSGGTSVFSVGTNGSITATGNGVDWLNATYQGVVGSAPISVGQCSYTLTPTGQIVDYEGAPVSIQISTQSGCSWTASSNSAWLTFAQASGSGSSTLNATASANASGSQRTAFVKVGSVLVTVTQPATSCSYVSSPTTINVPSAGGSGTISVSTSCPFISSSDESWAIATNLSQSSVAYYVEANSGPQSRTATLSIGTGKVTITQSGVPVGITPTVTVTPASTSITTAQQLSVTVAVSGGSGNPTPTGSVKLTGGGYSNTQTLSGGSVAFSIAAGSLSTGSDTFTGNYTPDSNSSSVYNSATGTSPAVSVIGATPPPTPVITGISPLFVSAGSAAFTLNVNGSGFTANSTVDLSGSTLATTYVSATQLTAQVTAADISAPESTSVQVVTLVAGSGETASNQFGFVIDSAGSAATAPTFTTATATVTAGSTASYPVTLPSSVVSETVYCLNLPTGASCNYSSTASTVTIATTSSTPAGTYQVTVLFGEIVSGPATAWILLPILLLPLALLRRKLAVRGVWITASLGLVLLAATAIAGCGGGGWSSSTGTETHVVDSSAVVTLIVQ
jgi:hypothetical protein